MLSRLRDERGFSLVELVVAVGVFGMFLASAYAIIFGFMKDVDHTGRLAETIRETRPVMRSLVIELRQAVPPSAANGSRPVSLLAWDQVTFFSDRFPIDGDPERYAYSLTSCVATRCRLDVAVTQPDAATAPEYTYTGTPLARTVLTDVQASAAAPLFEGRTSAGVKVPSCSTSATCSFPLVVVDLQRLSGAGNGPWKPLQILEQVRFRNAAS